MFSGMVCLCTDDGDNSGNAVAAADVGDGGESFSDDKLNKRDDKKEDEKGK